MSLLMDALRKAEQQKRHGAVSPAAPAGAGDGGGKLSLEPLTDPAGTFPPPPQPVAPQEDLDRRLPELPKRLEELDDQFFTTDPVLQKSIRAFAEAKTLAAEPIPVPGNTTGNARAAAQNVFAVKQTAPTSGHGFAISVGVGTLIAVAAIGGYFYWQMQPKGGLVAGAGLAAQQAAAPAQQAPAAQTIPASTTVLQTPPATLSQDAAAPPAAEQRAVRVSVPEAAKPAAGRQETVVVSRSPAAQPPQGLPPQPAALPDTVIRLSTRSGKPDGAMETAHAAFTRGETDLARAIWLKSLQSDSRNINALHGLAAIFQLEGKPDQAAVLYGRVLEVDPKDALAHAGLLAISVPADLRQAESQLKGLLAEQPNSPHLHFALGNLYLNDSRWAEAQQAFFKAHVADPANPDYLYNLAVSLDYLHQASLAAQYYARAQDAARSQPTAFDPAQVEERLRTLRNERQR